MLDIPPATVARAIGILRSGAMRADEFARRMWPERCADLTPGQQSRSGHALLRPLAQVGYVQRVGDLWTLRMVGTADGLGDSAVPRAVPTAVGLGVGLPVGAPVGPAVGLGVAPGDGLPERLPERQPNEPPRNEAERRADLDQLHWLVARATEPVESVTSDACLGDIEIRGEPLGNCRWQQCGAPPELPHREGWLFGPDGAIAVPECWLPEYRECGIYFDLEPLDEQIRRQRAAAGLA